MLLVKVVNLGVVVSCDSYEGSAGSDVSLHQWNITDLELPLQERLLSWTINCSGFNSVRVYLT